MKNVNLKKELEEVKEVSNAHLEESKEKDLEKTPADRLAEALE